MKILYTCTIYKKRAPSRLMKIKMIVVIQLATRTVGTAMSVPMLCVVHFTFVNHKIRYILMAYASIAKSRGFFDVNNGYINIYLILNIEL